MTRSGDRLRAIEQELRELKARLKHAERQQVSSSPLSLFWGQTWTPVEGDYPESPANCLPVVPIDYKFTEEVGPQEGTVERQREVPIQPALAPSHIPRGTTVLVMRDRQQRQNHILAGGGAGYYEVTTAITARDGNTLGEGMGRKIQRDGETADLSLPGSGDSVKIYNITTFTVAAEKVIWAGQDGPSGDLVMLAADCADLGGT